MSRSHVLVDKGLKHLDSLLLSDEALGWLEREELRTTSQVVQQAKICLNQYENYRSASRLEEALVLCLLLLHREVASSEQDRLRKRITQKGIEARKEQIRKQKGI